MESVEFVMPEYTTANGPQGLMDVLESLRLQADQDAEFRAREHYILYCFNEQKSFIKVDMSEQPFQFWYSDVNGRPATNAVKETIAEFLWERCGEKDRYDENSGRE
ncbi:MAG TPA: hypothetical protein VL360_04845 [Gammaproteobacteria bacterium]|jgi:hypothetical protein|nr:hypothetical protein [Gammaproteobacteria bacterium]